MGEKHIDFSSWESGGPLDQEHLKSCASCRETLELARFLKFQVDQAPRIEAPPFFATRVANIVSQTQEVPGSFWRLVELSARRLIPAFAALILVLLLFGSNTWVKQTTDEELWAALFAEPQVSEMMTLDEVLLSLQESLEENSEGQH